MTEHFSIVVFFNDEQLHDRRFDRSARTTLATAMTDRIRSVAPAANFGEPNPSACSVVVSGEPDTLADVITYLDHHKNIGRYIIDGNLIRPAR